MYHTGIIHTAELNRFFSFQTIQELELDTSDNFFVDSIDEDNSWKCDSEPQLEAPTSFIPPYFSSMLFAPFNDIIKCSRPVTHELVSPLDEVMPLTGSRSVSGVTWPTPAPTSDSFAAYDPVGQPTLHTSPEDEEDNWVDFAAVQYQLKLEAASNLNVQDEDDLEFLEWGLLDDPLTKGKNISMGLKPVRVARPIWPHGPRMATRV